MVIFLYNQNIFVWMQHDCLTVTDLALDPSKKILKQLWSDVLLILTFYNIKYLYGSFFQKLRDRLKPFVVDTIPYMHKALSNGKHVLVEGAQSNVLDIDFGLYCKFTYFYVDFAQLDW